MKAEFEKCMAGEPFIGERDPQIMEMTLRTKRLLAEFNATDLADTARRQQLLRDMLGRVGQAVHVDMDFHCEYGRNSVVGAGSVVTRSIPANCVAVGNPCRVIRQIDNGELA